MPINWNMEFKEKYTYASDKEAGKKEISDDAYAVGELLDILVKKIEQTRLSLIK